MRMFIPIEFIPHHVEMFSCEIDREHHPLILEINTDWGIVETLDYRTLGNDQFSITERDFVDVLSLKSDFIVDVDEVYFWVKLEACRIWSLKVCILHDNP